MIVVSCNWYILSSVNIHNYVIRRFCSDQSFTAFPCFSLWEEYGSKVLMVFWSNQKRPNLFWSVFHCISMPWLAKKVWQQSSDGFLVNPKKENLGWLLAWNSFMVMLIKNIGFCSARSSEGNWKHFQLCVWICFAVMWLWCSQGAKVTYTGLCLERLQAGHSRCSRSPLPP